MHTSYELLCIRAFVRAVATSYYVFMHHDSGTFLGGRAGAAIMGWGALNKPSIIGNRREGFFFLRSLPDDTFSSVFCASADDLAPF
jgi:hypothetical protein